MRDTILLGGIATIVIAQRAHYEAIEEPGFDSRIHACPAVDLVEHLVRVVQPWRWIDTPEERGLTIIQHEPLRGERHSGGLVPAVHGPGQPDIQQMTGTGTEPV